ncbi:MAG: amidohydrolase family protein [Phycisphaerae bacterium]|nr:amidohydrolase family protein [Phycisphaerae bacterium]
MNTARYMSRWHAIVRTGRPGRPEGTLLLAGIAVLAIALSAFGQASGGRSASAGSRDRFVIIVDPAAFGPAAQVFQEELKRRFAADKNAPELVLVEGAESKVLAAKVLAVRADGGTLPQGLLDVRSSATPDKPSQAFIEAYHYPFGAIARDHLESPEYSFKFASWSALLAISLHQSLASTRGGERALFGETEMRMATDANPHLPREILGRTVRLVCQEPKPLATGRAVRLASLVKEAVAGLSEQTSTCHMMGVVSEKVIGNLAQQLPAKVLIRKGNELARARTERVLGMPVTDGMLLGSVEVRVFKYEYPDRESLKLADRLAAQAAGQEPPDQVGKLVATVRPSPSGLYVISGLDPLAPYVIRFIDTSKDRNHPLRQLDEVAFVTSSRQGIVRTVPGKHSRYLPLPDEYRPPPPVLPDAKVMDYVIEGATVFDGSKDKPRFTADLGVIGERIAAIGDLSTVTRRGTIVGRGLFLMPGFVDIHSHADDNVLKVADAPSHIRQGITTVLAGNCASSPLGIGAFLDEVDRKGSPLNLAVLIGNAPVRERVMGKRKGLPTTEETYRQKELVDLAMEEGAFGMSTGLIYAISEQAFPLELAELAKQLKPYGGFYASHIRDESDGVLGAVREALFIGELAEVPVQISHMKANHKRNWGAMERYLEIMKAARTRGMDVTGDQYPWRASGPAAHYTLHKLLVRDAIRAGTPEVILLKNMPGQYAKYSGRPLTELLAAEKITPQQLIDHLKLTEDSPVHATYLCIGEEDLCRAMKEDIVMVCTDAGLASSADIAGGKVSDAHPRKFRTYPEFFARYVRDRKILSWELGVYKCTGLPAQRLKLTDRGVLKPGAFADLVLLDPTKLDPGSDFRDQAPPPRGIQWVFLNGRPVLKDGQPVDLLAGKALRGFGHERP